MNVYWIHEYPHMLQQKALKVATQIVGPRPLPPWEGHLSIPTPCMGWVPRPKNGFRSSRVKWQATSGCVTRAKILEIRLASEKRPQLFRQGNWKKHSVWKGFSAGGASCLFCLFHGGGKKKKVQNNSWRRIWVFPKIVVPPNHPF